MYQNVHGGDIYGKEIRLDYSVNINPFGIPESVISAVCEGACKNEAYPDTECRSLIQKLSLALGVKKEYILCGSGAAELILSLAMALHPENALLVAPGFAEYEQSLSLTGCRIRYYQCLPENGFALQEDYLSMITPDLDVLFLCTPNNPTGIPLSREFLKKVLAKCEENHVLMILDECFVRFLEDYEQRTMMGETQSHPSLLILRAFTKIFAMPGLRLGYCVCSDTDLTDRIRAFMQPWNVSVPAQLAGEAALTELEYVENSCRYVQQERNWLTKQLGERGLICMESRANYIFFEGPAYLYAAMAQRGILIRDCSNYRGLGPGYFRIAVKKREDNRIFLEELDRVLSEWICAR